MSMRLPVNVRNSMMGGLASWLGPGPLSLNIYSGTRPSSVSDAPGAGNTLLCTLSIAFPSSATNGALALSAPTSGTVVATNTATWGRVVLGGPGGGNIFDIDVSGSGGGGDIELDSASLVSGTTLTISSWTLTLPETIT